MIPYDRIIAEMERQLGTARQAGDERAMREALTAIKSLCEVALGGEVEREEKIIPKNPCSESTCPIHFFIGRPAACGKRCEWRLDF